MRVFRLIRIIVRSEFVIAACLHFVFFLLSFCFLFAFFMPGISLKRRWERDKRRMTFNWWGWQTTAQDEKPRHTRTLSWCRLNGTLCTWKEWRDMHEGGHLVSISEIWAIQFSTPVLTLLHRLPCLLSLFAHLFNHSILNPWESVLSDVPFSECLGTGWFFWVVRLRIATVAKRTKPEVCASQHLKALCLTFTLMYLLRVRAFVFLVKSRYFYHA